jgi:hypothetical protein
LRVTIGRTYEWYELMGEFEGVYERLEADGVCKYCKRARYCEWPAPTPNRLSRSSAISKTGRAS